MPGLDVYVYAVILRPNALHGLVDGARPHVIIIILKPTDWNK